MKSKKGFTLVEILIIMGILAILFTITSLNLTNTVPQSSLDNTVRLFIADLKQQQLNALTGNTEGQGDSSDYGIYFTSGKYTLFRGSSYNASDPANFDVVVDDIDTSSTSAGSVIVFLKNSGIIKNFSPSNNTITFTQTNIGSQKTITINKYGVIESVL